MRRSVLAFVATLALVTFTAGVSSAREAASGSDPLPIRGGIKVPDGPFIHAFAPGPVGLNPFTQGEDFEPSTIRNFRGFVAMAYMQGKAKDAAGKEYFLDSDMRVYRGTYIGADGHEHRGTFAFI